MISKYLILLGTTILISGAAQYTGCMWLPRIESEGTVRVHTFFHPYVQTLLMFFGEMLSLIIYWMLVIYKRYVKGECESLCRFNPLVFLPPAFLDVAVSSTIFIAMKFAHYSSFHLFSGAVVLVIAMLSKAFLNLKLDLINWIGIAIIVVDGFFIIGLADIIPASCIGYDVNGLIAGSLLYLCTQIFRAIQKIYEEVIMKKYDIHPLNASGLEGLFGSLILVILLVPFYYSSVGWWSNDGYKMRIEDPLEAITQISNSIELLIAVIVYIISSALYNPTTMILIKDYDAITYIVFDSLRAVPVWSIALIVGWLHIYFLHIIGFILLIFGVCLYFNITILPLCRKYLSRKSLNSFPIGQINGSNNSFRDRLLLV